MDQKKNNNTSNALPPITPMDKVTRVEVIDEHGRSYVNWNSNNKVTLSLQDNGKTLKVFIDKKTE